MKMYRGHGDKPSYIPDFDAKWMRQIIMKLGPPDTNDDLDTV
jgi:hypothetical protein